MKKRTLICLFFLLLGDQFLKAQSLQLGVMPGASLYPDNSRISAAKIGLDIEFIPGFSETWFFSYGWDFYFKRSMTINHELSSVQTNQKAGVFTNVSFDQHHVGGQLSVNHYLVKDAFSTGGIYVGLGFRFDIFTAKNIRSGTYNDSVYYLYTNFFGTVTSSSFEPEDDWSNMGMVLQGGYLLRLKDISIRPSFNLGFYINPEQPALDIRSPGFFMGIDLTLAYVFENIRWPSRSYGILSRRLKY